MGKIYVNYSPNSDLSFNFAEKILDYYKIEYETTLPEEVEDELAEKGLFKWNSFYKTYDLDRRTLNEKEKFGELETTDKNVIIFYDESDITHVIYTDEEGAELIDEFINLVCIS